MSYLSTARVQRWLETTKLTISAVDSDLESAAVTYVLSRLAGKYDVSGWDDSATTPGQVLDLASCLYAAWTYEKQYSEDLPIDGSNWGARLERFVAVTLDALLNGSAELMDADGEIVTPDSEAVSDVLYFPTDLQDTDEEGNEIKFTMGKLW